MTTQAQVQYTPTNGTFTVDGNNNINTSTSTITNGYVQFALEDSPNITWWKGIKVFDANNNMICLIGIQDQDHGPDTSKEYVSAQFNQHVKVEIWKAKFLGVHTCMATEFFDLNDLNGKKLTFNWVND